MGFESEPNKDRQEKRQFLTLLNSAIDAFRRERPLERLVGDRLIRAKRHAESVGFSMTEDLVDDGHKRAEDLRNPIVRAIEAIGTLEVNMPLDSYESSLVEAAWEYFKEKSKL